MVKIQWSHDIYHCDLIGLFTQAYCPPSELHPHAHKKLHVHNTLLQNLSTFIVYNSGLSQSLRGYSIHSPIQYSLRKLKEHFRGISRLLTQTRPCPHPPFGTSPTLPKCDLFRNIMIAFLFQKKPQMLCTYTSTIIPNVNRIIVLTCWSVPSEAWRKWSRSTAIGILWRKENVVYHLVAEIQDQKWKK